MKLLYGGEMKLKLRDVSKTFALTLAPHHQAHLRYMIPTRQQSSFCCVFWWCKKYRREFDDGKRMKEIDKKPATQKLVIDKVLLQDFPVESVYTLSSETESKGYCKCFKGTGLEYVLWEKTRTAQSTLIIESPKKLLLFLSRKWYRDKFRFIV